MIGNKENEILYPSICFYKEHYKDNLVSYNVSHFSYFIVKKFILTFCDLVFTEDETY